MTSGAVAQRARKAAELRQRAGRTGFGGPRAGQASPPAGPARQQAAPGAYSKTPQTYAPQQAVRPQGYGGPRAGQSSPPPGPARQQAAPGAYSTTGTRYNPRPSGTFGAVPPSVNGVSAGGPRAGLPSPGGGPARAQAAPGAYSKTGTPYNPGASPPAIGSLAQQHWSRAQGLAGRAGAAITGTGAAIAGLAGGPAAAAQVTGRSTPSAPVSAQPATGSPMRAPVAQQPRRPGGAYPGTPPVTGTAAPAGGPVGPAPGTDNPAARPAPTAGVSPGSTVSNSGAPPASGGPLAAAPPATTTPDDNPAALPNYGTLSERLGLDFSKGFTVDTNTTDYSLAGNNIGAAQHQLRGQGAAADWQNDVINNAAAAGQFGKTLRARGPDGKDFTFRLDGKPEQWAGINSEEARGQRMMQQVSAFAQNDWRTQVAANTETNSPTTAGTPTPGGSIDAPPAAVAGDQHGQLMEARRQMAFLNAPDSQAGRRAVTQELANQAGLSPGENLNAYSIPQLEQKARDANLSNRGAVTAEEFNTPSRVDFAQAATMQPLAAKTSDWFQAHSRSLGNAALASGEIFQPASGSAQVNTVLNANFNGMNPEAAQAAFAAEGLRMPLSKGTAEMVAAGIPGNVIGGRNGQGTGRREAGLGFFDADSLPPLNPDLVSAPSAAGAPGVNPFQQTFDPAAAGFSIDPDPRRRWLQR